MWKQFSAFVARKLGRPARTDEREDPRLPLLERVKAAFDANPDAFIEATTDPTHDDFAFIGKLIQLYTFADLCARRIIDDLREAAYGPGKRNGSVLQDAQVFPKLREAAELLWDCPLKDGIIKAANTIEMHRQHRHNFAHWSARRVPEENLLILLSKNANEGKRRDGNDRDAYHWSYGIVPLDGFDLEMDKLDGHTHYLSKHAYLLDHGIDELRREFDRRGMHTARRT